MPKFKWSKGVKNALGGVLVLAGSALAFLALYSGGLTVPVLLAMCALLILGGHLISSSDTTHFISSIVIPIIKAWKGTDNKDT